MPKVLVSDSLSETAVQIFRDRGIDVADDEIFVSDGSKCDTGNIQEIFDVATRIAIPDPVYPVYLDTNVMAGRSGSYRDGRYDGIVYLDGGALVRSALTHGLVDVLTLTVIPVVLGDGIQNPGIIRTAR